MNGDQDPQARIWGGTLDLHPATGQQVMAQAGLLERYFALARPMGRILTDDQGAAFFTREPQADNPEINRNVLRTMLLDSLADKTVVWNYRLTRLAVRAGKWQLHFADQQSVMADVVIGANGGLSAVRQYLTDSVPRYTGTVIMQGDVPQPETGCPAFYRLCNRHILMAAANGNLLVANPDNNGALTYAVMFAAPETWLQQQDVECWENSGIRSYLAGRFSGWDACFQELFRNTAAFRCLPARRLPLDRPWHPDRPLPLTLIGDAAHLMPPFAGQGVNTGLMDALILSENLTTGRFGSIADAIRDYEAHMRVYASEAQQASAHNERAMRDPDFSFRQLMMKSGDQ